MKTQRMLEWLYMTNATVLIAHQIDAAYWHEWDLFGMPGGIQLNVLLNLPIMLLILYGLRALAVGWRSGIAIAWLLAATGFFAAGIHAYFLVRGNESFTLPVSVGLLVATCVLSLAQAITLLANRGGQRHAWLRLAPK